MIKVITADDHALIRKGVMHILSKTSDIEAADEAEDGRQLLKKLRRSKYDIILLDINMPGMDVFDLIREIKKLKNDTPILILSMLPEDQFGLQVLKAGAKGYLNKSSELNNLVAAIKRICNGERYVSPQLAEKLADSIATANDMPHETLSEREFQVLCLLSTGKTVSEVAEHLFLSVKTISTYRSRILEKMALENNAQLTYYAIQNRLV